MVWDDSPLSRDLVSLEARLDRRAASGKQVEWRLMFGEKHGLHITSSTTSRWRICHPGTHSRPIAERSPDHPQLVLVFMVFIHELTHAARDERRYQGDQEDDQPCPCPAHGKLHLYGVDAQIGYIPARNRNTPESAEMVRRLAAAPSCTLSALY